MKLTYLAVMAAIAAVALMGIAATGPVSAASPPSQQHHAIVVAQQLGTSQIDPAGIVQIKLATPIDTSQVAGATHYGTMATAFADIGCPSAIKTLQDTARPDIAQIKIANSGMTKTGSSTADIPAVASCTTGAQAPPTMAGVHSPPAVITVASHGTIHSPADGASALTVM